TTRPQWSRRRPPAPGSASPFRRRSSGDAGSSLDPRTAPSLRDGLAPAATHGQTDTVPLSLLIPTVRKRLTRAQLPMPPSDLDAVVGGRSKTLVSARDALES